MCRTDSGDGGCPTDGRSGAHPQQQPSRVVTDIAGAGSRGRRLVRCGARVRGAATASRVRTRTAVVLVHEWGGGGDAVRPGCAPAAAGSGASQRHSLTRAQRVPGVQRPTLGAVVGSMGIGCQLTACKGSVPPTGVSLHHHLPRDGVMARSTERDRAVPHHGIL